MSKRVVAAVLNSKMTQEITLHVNGEYHQVNVDPDTPLLYVLRHDLGLKSPHYGCGNEQCGACKVLVDGQAVPSCQLAVSALPGMQVITVEGVAPPGTLHALQEAFIAEQAAQCGYCTSGMIITAQALLNRVRYPTDDDIREALAGNLCRCGVYDRVRRAIKLRIGRPEFAPIFEVRTAATTPEASSAAHDLPAPLLQNPQLDSWIRINSDETITVFSGKVDYGQGIKTAMAQMAAEELDVSLGRICVVMADTAQTPDEGMTVGSMSLETSGSAIRLAAAEARRILLSIAYEMLEAPLEQLVVLDGTISYPQTGASVTYWELHGGRKFGRVISGGTPLKETGAYRIVGQPARQLGLPAKVSGGASFVHDLQLPGLLFGRVVRPPNFDARLISLELEAVSKMPGVVKVVRNGRFLGVIAEREYQAILAMEKLRAGATWQGEANLPPYEALYDTLLQQTDQPFLIVEGIATGDPIPALERPAEAAKTLEATYKRPFQMHASLGPSAAVALLSGGKLTVWTHAQGVYPVRAAIAPILGMSEADVRLIYMDGPGVYGHNGADDAALDAALLAQAVPGRPVSLQWTRADEHTWEPYTPAMVIKLQASLDGQGDVIDWNHDVWSPAHIGRSRPGGNHSNLVAAWHLSQPYSPAPSWPARDAHGGGHRNADPLYTFDQRRIVKHFLPNSLLRSSSMRGLGAYANIFAIESFMDELAIAAGIGPVEFRLRHLVDKRARAVIEAAAQKAGWRDDQFAGSDGRGRGFAFAQYKNRQTYTAVVVDLAVDRSSGAIQLERAVIAADAGQIINPDGLSNQLEGGFVQAASWTLYEQVMFDERGISSTDWDSYPILRFSNAPAIETVLLNGPDRPHVGGGEASLGPTPAAIGNAIYQALGIRLRQVPFSPQRVQTALAVL